MLLNCTFKLYLKTSFFFVKNVENSEKLLLFFLQFTKKFNVQCKFYQPSASSTKNFRDYAWHFGEKKMIPLLNYVINHKRDILA